MANYSIELLSEISESAQKIYNHFESIFGERHGGYLSVFSTDSDLLQTTRISDGHHFEKESVERKCLILTATPAAISSSQTIAHSKGAIKVNNSLIIGFSCKSMGQNEKELFIFAVARSVKHALGETSFLNYDGDIISLTDLLSITENSLLTKETINQLIKGD